jgi:transposase-like protein
LRLQLHRYTKARQARGDEGPDRSGGAVLLYAMGNASYGMIARLFGVSEVAVFKWIRKEAAALPEPVTPAEVEIVQLDEMWHFVDGKKNKCWLWRAFDPVSRRALAWVLGQRDDPTCKKLLDKVGIEGRIFLTDDWDGYRRCIPEAQLLRHLTKDR